MYNPVNKKGELNAIIKRFTVNTMLRSPPKSYIKTLANSHDNSQDFKELGSPCALAERIQQQTPYCNSTRGRGLIQMKVDELSRLNRSTDKGSVSIDDIQMIEPVTSIVL